MCHRWKVRSVGLLPTCACSQLPFRFGAQRPSFAHLTFLYFTASYNANKTTLPTATMDRLATILANLRRRDNIRDFIDGLEDSECWPYPDGESRPIAPTPEFCDCCGEPSLPEVVLRKDKIEELTQLFLTNVHRYHALAPLDRGNVYEAPLTDVSIELCPEEGAGAYAVSYEVVDKAQRSDAPTLDLRDVATIRSAFMHRYEWVINKFHSVKEDRREAWEIAEHEFEIALGLGEPTEDPIESENEVPLSEEEDHDALQPDSDISVSAHCLCWLNLVPRRS
jgi:hypothetical protein